MDNWNGRDGCLYRIINLDALGFSNSTISTVYISHQRISPSSSIGNSNYG